ncbi:MAG: hypothetical protein K2Y71_29600 [Xanthobacteraceae bacterium]|nr:hypothetical protein [Xanthobacteraceae bacterium]
MALLVEPVSWATIEVEKRLLSTKIRTRRGNSDYPRSAPFYKLIGKPNPDPLQKNLRRALEQLDELFDLKRAIEEICVVANEATAFAVRGADFADRMTWEALPLIFDHEERRPLFAPVRVHSTTSPWRPERSEERLRIVSLVGHPGRWTAFSFEKIEALIRQIYAELAAPQRELVDSPDNPIVIDVSDAEPSAWTAQVGAARPHLVLYFGHGESTPNPRIQISLNDWIPLSDVAARIAATGIAFPPFWSFVACSLGESSQSGGASVHGPAAFDILNRLGAVSMVAMRSPIRVSVAKVFLSDYLSRFISGNAPELAAAGARHVVFSSELVGTQGPHDWASAAVWSIAEPIKRVTWGADDSAARTSDMALRLLRRSSQEESLGAAMLRNETFQKANIWRERRRVRIDLPLGSAKGSPLECAVLLEAARRQFGACPILIDVPEGGPSYAGRLKQWAQNLRMSLLPATDDATFAAAIGNLAIGAEDGLKGLLALPRAFVIFVSAPAKNDVMWDIILSAPADTTVAVCQPEDVSGLPSDTWFRDGTTDETQDSDQLINAALTVAPKSIAILAAEPRPIRAADLSAITGEPASPAVDGVLVRRESGSGLVLADRYRERTAALVGRSAIVAAHNDLARYLSAGGQTSLAWGDLAILRHLARAERWAELARAVNAFVETRHGTVDWIGLARVLSTLPPEAFGAIYPEIYIEIGQRLVQLQDLEGAAIWLDRALPTRDVDKARRASLLSEVWKGRNEPGARDEMWKEAEAAVALCKSELAGNPNFEPAERDLREHELQLARLKLYFRGDAQEARNVFERLLTDWEGDSRPEALRAICAAKRNLAECLFEFAPFKDDPAQRAIASKHLAEAGALCLEHRLSLEHRLTEIRCDILYSQAKLAEKEANIQGAINFLTDCAAEARQCSYEVAHRIADARRYWLEVRRQDRQWDAATFRAYQQPLDFLDWHLWAVRYGAQSRLWGARRFADSNAQEAACAALHRTREQYQRRAVLSGKSDKATLARACAGLAVLGMRRPWDELAMRDDMQQWSTRSAAEVWAEVS